MTFIIAFVLVLFSLAALLPPFLAILGNYPGTFIERYELFLGDHAGTFVSLGTVFLVAGFAVWAAVISNAAADQREVYSRRMQAALQKAQFRQKWIDDLREDLAVCISDIQNKTTDYDTLRKKLNLILLRLPMHEKEARELTSALGALMKRVSDNENKDATEDPTSEALILAQELLRKEWVALKKELEDAEGIELK